MQVMISELFIRAALYSPEISLSGNGRITISGRCIPREPDEFFAPLMDWAASYCQEPAEETIVEVSIEYINGTNHGKLYKFLTKLKEVTFTGKKMAINFNYESDDEQMRDVGLQWTELLKVPVNMISVGKLDLPDMKGLPADGNKTQSAE